MSDPQVSQVDLLIVGAGPAGLLLALWASQFNICARIIDDKHTRIEKGQADGLHPRTLEVLDSFGLGDTFLREACPITEICSWVRKVMSHGMLHVDTEYQNPDPADETRIKRGDRVAAQPSGLSRFAQVSLNQGTTEHIFLDSLAATGRLKVDRSLTPEELHIDENLLDDHDSYPLTLVLRKLETDEAAAKIRLEGKPYHILSTTLAFTT